MKSETKIRNNIVVHPAMPPFADIQRGIADAKLIYVGSHLDPDGDSLGTQLAVASYLQSLGKNVIVCRDGNIPDKYQFLPGCDEIPLCDDITAPGPVDTALILECPNPSRLGKGQKLISPNTKVINIDHHIDNTIYGHINWVNSGASSVGEMMYEYLQFAGYKLSREEAVSLYTAILTDTGRFRYNSTSARTMEIAGELIDAGADPYAIVEQIYYRTKPSTLKLLGRVLGGMEMYHDGQLCMLSVTNKMMAECEARSTETEGIVDWTLLSDGVLVGVFVKEVDAAKSKASLRSKDVINVAAIAADFGGGGHVNAAGCVIELPLEKAKALLVEKIGEALNSVA